ncbi:MAG TPA: response regulator [Thermoanaerobaculia bacterium]|nr:response regulator [Thermoanaerobaculia bacterium]
MAESTRRLLLVEREPDTIEEIRSFLHGLPDLQLVITEQASEACERLLEERYDLVLLDLFLADESGFDTFLRLFAQVPDVPIVILAAAADEELAMQAVGAGADSYLVKRRDQPDTARKVIEQALARGRAPGGGDRILSPERFLEKADRYIELAIRGAKRVLLSAVALDVRSDAVRERDLARDILVRTFRASDLIARFADDRFVALAIMNREDNGSDVLSARFAEIVDEEARSQPLAIRMVSESVEPDEVVAADDLVVIAERLFRSLA